MGRSCGQTVIGNKINESTWYVCGSQPYSAGKGCRPGVYVPVTFIEDSVIEGIQRRIHSIASHAKIAQQLN